MEKNIRIGIGALAGLLLLRNLYVILFNLPDEMDQGPIYRIFFYHLPAYFTAMCCYLAALAASVLYLTKRDLRYDAVAMAATEVGLAFAAVNLITGMIWGRVIWGIWWAWDARLTWALICWLVYFGYLMLRQAIDDPSERAKNSAVLSIFSFVSVAITYKAIEWWRTQHPGPVLSFRTG
ncbi:MAG: cytochrome c biogenesis protein CcsA, partial [Acidobacteriota bacterium]